jgi:prolyl oligopeptidase
VKAAVAEPAAARTILRGHAPCDQARDEMRDRFLTLCVMLALPVPVPAQSASDSTRYEMHGGQVPDLHRALEHTQDPAVVRWARQQDSLTRAMLHGVPGATAVHSRVRALATLTTYGVPLFAGVVRFHLEVDGRTDERRIVRRDADGRETRLLLEPAPGGGAQLSNFAPDPTGRRLIYELHDEVAGTRTLVLGDIAADGVVRARAEFAGMTTSEMPWLPDGIRFAATRSAPGRDTVFLITAERPGELHLVHTADDDETVLRPRVSEDGAWLLVTANGGAGSTVDAVSLIAARRSVRLTQPTGEVMDFIGTRADRLLFRTDAGAPTGRVVSVDPADASPTHWREVVSARAGATLRGAYAAGGRLVLSYLEGPAPFLIISDADAERRIDIPLGLLWTDHLVGWPPFSARDDQSVAYFRSINLSAPGIYALDVDTGDLSPYQLRDTGIDPSAFEAKIEYFTSRDGTRIPLFLIGRRDRPAGPHPTLVFAYGAYGFTAVPFFNAKYVTFVENGGTFAIPFTRGDGVYGRDWHLAGTGAGKARTVEDLIAAAEYLIASGHSTATSLGIEGQGPGGMVAASAVILRPELWAAATLESPVTDPVRMLLRRGRASAEYGDPADAEVMRALLTISPYHQVRAGERYPPILIRTGDRDRTIDPYHAYKFAAALREASPAGETWLRVSWAEAHGFLRSAGRRADEWADDLVFLKRFLRVH